MKKVLKLIMCFCLVLSLFTHSLKVKATSYSGKCGDTITWELDEESGLLTISGTGKMYDYLEFDETPIYEYREDIKSIIVDEGVTTIGAFMFPGCKQLENVKLSNTVTYIKENAFYGDTSLQNIEWGNSLYVIEWGAFSNCTSITTLSFPDSFRFLGGDVFRNCTSLIEVKLNEGLKYIEETAFRDCVNLKTINLPNSLMGMDGGVFKGCKSLEEMIIPEQVDYLPDTFADCTSLRKVTIYSRTIDIDASAFKNCPNVTIYAYDDSDAILYAKKNNIPFGFIYCNEDEHSFYIEKDIQSTCIEKGYTEYTCLICGYSYTTYKELASHTVVSDKAISPTCTTQGKTAGSHCKVCGLVFELQEVIPAKGHNYVIDQIIEPTYEQEGVKYYKCTNCERTYCETIPQLIHTHTIVEDPYVEATCTLSGVTDGKHCVECGEIIEKQSYIAPLGHDYKTTVVLPSSTSEGYDLHRCTRCGDSYKDNFVDKLEVSELPFIDVPLSKWYYPYIKEAYDLNLMTGKSEILFDPLAYMTRGQVATVLYRMANSPEVTYKDYFPDVYSNKYYTSAVTWCYENGIISGYGDGTFRPSSYINRQELAIMLRRYSNMIGNLDINQSSSLDRFEDALQVSKYATDSVQWAVANGIISGKSRNGLLYIAPKEYATRAECCKMLLVLYQMMYQ